MNWITTGPYSKRIRIYNKIESGGGSLVAENLTETSSVPISPEAVQATQRDATKLAEVNRLSEQAERDATQANLDGKLSQLTSADMSDSNAIENTLKNSIEKAWKEMDSSEYKTALANWEKAMENDPKTLGKITQLLWNGTNASSWATLKELMDDPTVRERLTELWNLSIIPIKKAMEEWKVDPSVWPAIENLQAQFAAVRNK
jgi:hypothetical protein